MPSRRLNALCALLVLAIFLMPAVPVLALVEEGDRDAPAAPAQTGLQGPVRTPYYVKATSGGPAARGDLSPVAINESAVEAELQAPGQMIPRYLMTVVGTFSITLQAPIEVSRVDKVVVWAKGREPVTNAYFRVYFLRNGARITTINTQQQNMDLNPIAFEGQDLPIFSSPVKFAAGETMGIQIIYGAKSRRIIGPAPDAVVLANSYQHATRIEVSTRPLILNITTPVIVGRQAQFTAQIVDSAGQSPDGALKVQTTIIPTTGATAKIGKNDLKIVTSSQTAVMGMNGYVINYTWDYSASRATDGTYEFKLDASYGVLGVNYTNTSAFDLKFPPIQQKVGIFQKKATYYGIGIIVAVVAVLAVAFAWRRRSYYPRYARAYGGRPPRGYYGRPAPPPARPPKPPKVSRWGRKGKEKPVMAKGAMAPMGAGSPPPRGMPPQRRPEGRAPPAPIAAMRGPMPAGMPVAAVAAARPPPRAAEGRPAPPPARGQMPPGRPMGARPPQRAPNGGRPPPPQGAPRRGPPPQDALRRGPPPQMGPDGRPMRPRGPPPNGARPPPRRGQGPPPRGQAPPSMGRAPPPREGDPRAAARRRAP